MEGKCYIKQNTILKYFAERFSLLIFVKQRFPFTTILYFYYRY